MALPAPSMLSELRMLDGPNRCSDGKTGFLMLLLVLGFQIAISGSWKALATIHSFKGPTSKLSNSLMGLSGLGVLYARP